MMTEWQEAIASIRLAYFNAGSTNGPACHSADCLGLAVLRVFWPVAPGEADPLYCEPCASRARRVLEALGVKYRDERLPPRPGGRRAMEFP